MQDEGPRVLPIVTEEGLHRCMNFRVALAHKASVSASKVCHQGDRIIVIPSQDKVSGTSGFSPAAEPSVSHQVEDQPMNPDDTVQVLQEDSVEAEDANAARGLPSPTQPTRKDIQEHVLTHPDRGVDTAEAERKEPFAFSK